MGQPIPGLPDAVLIEVEADPVPVAPVSVVEDQEDEQVTKRMKLDPDESVQSNQLNQSIDSKGRLCGPSGQPININHPRYDPSTGTFKPRMVHYKPRKDIPFIDVPLAKSDATMKGHTAFLTFATCPPSTTPNNTSTSTSTTIDTVITTTSVQSETKNIE